MANVSARLARVRDGLTPREWSRAGAMVAVVVGLNVAGWVMLAAAVSGHYHITNTEIFGFGTGTLPPDRATTGSAVLNMARQVGSAVGVAVVVVILGAGAARTVTDFHHVWAAEAIAGLIASFAVAVTARRGAVRA